MPDAPRIAEFAKTLEKLVRVIESRPETVAALLDEWLGYAENKPDPLFLSADEKMHLREKLANALELSVGEFNMLVSAWSSNRSDKEFNIQT